MLDGEAAIEAMQAAQAADPFDAMILDIHMPGIDGYEVARRLRAKGFQTPIIALTAVAMVGDREKCLQAGCDDYSPSPSTGGSWCKSLPNMRKRPSALLAPMAAN